MVWRGCGCRCCGACVALLGGVVWRRSVAAAACCRSLSPRLSVQVQHSAEPCSIFLMPLSGFGCLFAAIRGNGGPPTCAVGLSPSLSSSVPSSSWSAKAVMPTMCATWFQVLPAGFRSPNRLNSAPEVRPDEAFVVFVASSLIPLPFVFAPAVFVVLLRSSARPLCWAFFVQLLTWLWGMRRVCLLVAGCPCVCLGWLRWRPPRHCL